ncbi:MAG: diguanylate cyclase [Gammaproteobacteria bacterium]|nr:diguanylate cyclase [Gammaproteobacteria bacterium]
MNYRPRLKLFLPYFVATIVIVAIFLTLVLGFTSNKKELIDSAHDNIRRDIAALSNLAQKTITSNSQLLEDAITHLTTDPIVKHTAVITPYGVVLFASNFSWRGEPAALSVPDYNHELFQKSVEKLGAQVAYSPDNNTVVAMMSFSYPGNSPTIRSLKKGAIFISYDLTHKLLESYKNTLYEHTPELVVFSVLVLCLMWLLQRFVINPVENMVVASRRIANSDYSVRLLPSGSRELSALSDAFNFMTEKVTQNIRELNDKGNHIQGILDNTFDGIISIDDKGLILSFNKTAETMFDMRADDVIGKNVHILMPSPFREQHNNYIGNFLQGNDAKIIGIGREVEGQRANGQTFPMDLAVTEITSNGSTIFIGILRDITDRKRHEAEVMRIQKDLTEANERLEKMAITDALTGVFNRRHFDTTLSLEINRAKRNHHSLSLLLFDVDHFKLYNDYYGHLKGDECLIAIAKASKSTFQRSGEVVARYGGEEFAVILPGVSLDDAMQAANMLIDNISSLNIEHKKSKNCGIVTISIGVATFSNNIHTTADELILEADNALYAAKESGRNQAAYYQAENNIKAIK